MFRPFSSEIVVLLNPRGWHPKRLGFHPMNRVNQLLERHREVSVHYHLIEEMRIEELYPVRVVQNLVEFLVL